MLPHVTGQADGEVSEVVAGGRHGLSHFASRVKQKLTGRLSINFAGKGEINLIDIGAVGNVPPPWYLATYWASSLIAIGVAFGVLLWTKSLFRTKSGRVS